MFYFIYVEGRDIPKKKYDDEAIAIQEAERLARLPDNVGRKVYLIKPTHYCVTEPSPLKWSEI